ncbi:hypothetical protein [Nitratiruptor tergarcus]|uniref:Uncharacterized protein n=1 Tax=Nitratiruptor tergarcus DSM 16512 TaxID=1069081 RepID=A0A1W1WV58_9BACT|nr:hypothetical protein [Nitratiruptor tergarcus]SMC10072.1 hypothetical protein SAMN05660197_1907 [Nitratiruptor tergarcus DSM 16512]
MTVLMVSRYFNDHPKVLDLFKKEIIAFIDQYNGNNVIRMGNILTGNIRKFLEENGYEIDVISMPRRGKGLYNKNIKMIKEATKVLAIQYENSPNIQKFINYAKQLQKPIEILHLQKLDIDKKLGSSRK